MLSHPLITVSTVEIQVSTFSAELWCVLCIDLSDSII